MKKTKRQFLFFLILLLVISPVINADSKPNKPRSTEVVLVARFKVTPPINYNFFQNYLKFKSPGVENNINIKQVKINDEYQSTLQLAFMRTTDATESSTAFGYLGKFCYTKISIPKDRIIILSYVRVFILNNALTYFNLPIQKKIIIPENVNYVYLGTFEYEIENEYFIINNASLSDEYDEAKKFVAATYDSNAELVRVNLINLK